MRRRIWMAGIGLTLSNLVVAAWGGNNPCKPQYIPPPMRSCYVNDSNCVVICMATDTNQMCCEEFKRGKWRCKIKDIDECCPSCSSGGGSTCSIGGGSGSGTGGSGGGPHTYKSADSNSWGGNVEFKISLGKIVGSEQTAGALYVNIPGPMSTALSPEWLSFRGNFRANVEIVVLGKKIQRVYAPQGDVLVAVSNDYAYELRFYEAGVLKAAGEGVPAEAPFTVWRVFDPDIGTNGNKRITFLQLTDGSTNNIVEYEWTSANSMAWHSGGGLRKDELSWSYSEVGGGTNRTDVHLVINPDDTVAERTVSTYRRYVFGDMLIMEQKGAEGEEVTTSIIEYYDDPGHQGRYGNISREVDERGAWARYDYDLEGRKVLEVTPWLDGDTNALDSASVVTMWDYTCLDSHEVPHLNDHRWRTELKMIANQWVGTSYRAYYIEGNEFIQIEEDAATDDSEYGDVSNRRTTRREDVLGADARLQFKPLSTVHPDGSEDAWQYQVGTYTVSSPDIGVFTEQEDGKFIRVTETLKANLEEPYKSTRTVSILDDFGQEIQNETWVCTGSNQYERMDWQTISRDDFGRELVRRYVNGLTTETTWGCCGKESETRPDGQSWSYVQDMLGRTTHTIKEDGPTEATVYDAIGQVLSKTLSGGELSISTSNRYDLAGRLVEAWDEAGLSTTISYGERTETVTRPGGATETTTRFRDGKTKFITGTGVIPVYYEYGIGSDGGQWTKAYTGSTSAPVWQLAVQDRQGQTVRTEKPAFGGTGVTNFYEYDDGGRLIRESKTGSLDNLYVYDERGELFRNGMDVNASGVLDLASMDRIREQRSEFVQTENNWFHQQTEILYPFDGSDAPFTNSISRTQVGGSGCACEAGFVEAVDARGNVYTRQTSVDQLLKQVTKIQTRPGIANAETTVSSNGLLRTRTLSTGAEYRYLYDGLGRQTGMVDPRTGTNLTVYLANGGVDYVEDAAGYRTVFGYDPATGRRISVTDAMTNTVHTAYDILGRVTNTCGAAYPVAYEYDAYGRMSAMKTWRDTNGSPDVTRWNYDEATGLLTNKVYADDKGPSYEYDATGRLAKRIWARGVTNAYAYDALGQLTGIDYFDSTPDVAFTYDRLGRQLTVTDVLGTRTNVYDGLDLVEERMPDGSALVRVYDSLGRSSGIALDDDYAIGYGYDAHGRFASAAVSNAVHVGYAYVTNSSLLAGWSVTNGATVAYAYESNRNLRMNVINTFDGDPISSFAYVNDAAGQRTQRVDFGLMTNWFSYNHRSELVDAAIGTNLYAYAYDAIGNRQETSANEVTNLYQANELNQYTNINAGAVEPTYDPDGNMLSDGIWTYSWDAENRLVEAFPLATNAGAKLIQFMYDFQCRKIGCRTFAWDAFGGISNWYYAKGEYYLYDGWNLLGELGPDVLPRTMVPYLPQTNLSLIGVGGKTNVLYVWGLDLSGTLQGAGGVGGLLMQFRSDADSPWFYCCDVNGNISDMVDTNGIIVARYEYDPYGNIVVQSGTQAGATPFQFSSKYRNAETELYYYGYRYYSPKLGRWINRDPLNENGFRVISKQSLRLASRRTDDLIYLNNNPVNKLDILGLWGCSRNGMSHDQICDAGCKIGNNKHAFGRVLCYKGEKCLCHYEDNAKNEGYEIPKDSAIYNCLMAHESNHYNNAKTPYCSPCCNPNSNYVLPPGPPPNSDGSFPPTPDTECDAYDAALTCMNNIPAGERDHNWDCYMKHIRMKMAGNNPPCANTPPDPGNEPTNCVTQ